MALTFEQLQNHAQHALGDGTPSSLLSLSNIVNDAGRHLYSMHQWNFAERPPVSLDFVASQAYATLPDDFGGMIAYQVSNDLTSDLQFVSPQRLADLRANPVVVTTFEYSACLSWPSRPTLTEPPPNPRMELWPTPTSATSDAVTLWYRAQWPVLVDSAEAAAVPWYAENLLIQLVRAFAQGYEEDARGTVDQRLDMIERGRVFDAAKTTDGLTQSDYGYQSGGAIQSAFGGASWRSASASPIADPS